MRDRGFFTPEGEGLVADLYLGYGLSSTIRRHRAPAPPGAVPAPAPRLSVRPPGYVVEYDNGRRREADATRCGSVGAWQRDLGAVRYAGAVERVREAIARGDVYQVNLVQHLSAPFSGDPGAIAARLAPLSPHNREPYRGDGWSVVSGSPELFLARRGRRVWTCPIKGTRPAGPTAARELRAVGEGRGRARDDRRPRAQRPLARLRAGQRAVARADGDARARGRRAHGLDGRGDDPRRRSAWPRCSRRRSPGDRSRAPRRSRRSTSSRSSSPSGAARRWERSGASTATATSTWRLTIRTFAIAEGRIHLWVGGGVVWDSDPAAEIAESWVKADPLLRAIGAPRVGARARRAAGARAGRGPRRDASSSGAMQRRDEAELLAVAGRPGRGLVEPGEPVLAADDEGFTRGRAAFETMRVYGGRPFRFEQHVTRLLSSAEPDRHRAARPGRDRGAVRPRARSTPRLPMRRCASTGRPGLRAGATARSRSSARSPPGSRRCARAASGSPRCCTSGVRSRGCSPRRSRRATPSAWRRRPRRRRAAPTTPSSSTPTGSCSRGR